MQGRIYSLLFNAVAVTAQQDFFEIVASANGNVCINEVFLSQSSEVGDAQEEGLNILMKTGATTTGSGGTTPTAVPRQLGDAAFGGTCKVNNTVKATAGTIVTHEAWNWNERMWFQRLWAPSFEVVIRPSTRLTIELATTPADVLTVSGFVLFTDLG